MDSRPYYWQCNTVSKSHHTQWQSEAGFLRTNLKTTAKVWFYMQLLLIVRCNVKGAMHNYSFLWPDSLSITWTIQISLDHSNQLVTIVLTRYGCSYSGIQLYLSPDLSLNAHPNQFISAWTRRTCVAWSFTKQCLGVVQDRYLTDCSHYNDKR